MKVRFLARLIPAVLTPLILASCHSGDPIGSGPPLPQWTTIASGSLDYLNSVWGSSASDVWSVGGSAGAGGTLHYNGTAWSIVPSGTTQTLYNVWGTSASDVWAVGGSSAATVMHYNGTAWSTALAGPTGVRFFATLR